MKLLKIATLALFLSVSSVSTVFAVSGDSYTPAHSIQQVEIKIKEAQEAITAGKDNKTVRSIILGAKKWASQINSVNVDKDKSKAIKSLNAARKVLKKIGDDDGDFDTAKEHLEKALQMFSTLESKL